MPAVRNGQYHRRKVAETGKIATGDLEIFTTEGAEDADTARGQVDPDSHDLQVDVSLCELCALCGKSFFAQ